VNITSYFAQQQAAKLLQGRSASFFDTLTIGTLLNTSGIRKIRGASLLTVFQSVFMPAFQGTPSF